MGPTVKDILGQLKGYFEKKNNFSKVKPIDYYRLLDGSLVNMQLLQYGKAFVLVATDNEYIKKETMYGERGMLRNSLDLALDVKDVLIPKALFVSNLAKAYSYKSDILPEFKDYAVKFLQDNRNDKYVVMLSPLVYKIFGMEQEFADFEETIGTYSDSYQEWFKKLKDI